MTERRPGPLEGILVVDVSRMLPGAVLARQLLDLGHGQFAGVLFVWIRWSTIPFVRAYTFF